MSPGARYPGASLAGLEGVMTWPAMSPGAGYPGASLARLEVAPVLHLPPGDRISAGHENPRLPDSGAPPSAAHT